MHQSTSGSNLKKTSTTVSYGSAKLKGFLWKDYTCLQPLNLNEGAGNVTNSTFIAKQENNDSKGYQTEEQAAFHKQEKEFSESNKCSMF